MKDVRLAVFAFFVVATTFAQDDITAAKRQYATARAASCRADDTECLAKFDFQWVFDTSTKAATMADPESRRQWLEAAAEVYQGIANSLPKNSQVLTNLALVRGDLGDWQGAAELLTRAAELDPRNAAAHFLNAAEICRNAKKWTEAEDFYRRAILKGSPEAGDRLLSMQKMRIDGSLPAGDTGAAIRSVFDSALEQLRRGSNAQAMDAYETIMRFSRASAPEAAKEALVRWVDAAAYGNVLNGETLGRLPSAKEWAIPARENLDQFVVRHDVRLPAWEAGLRMRHASAAAMRYRARSLTSEHPGDAAELYEAAIRRAPAPIECEWDDYLKRRPYIFVDAALDLARLLNSHRSLDPGGIRFRRLEDQLFDMKMGGYTANNPAVIQQLHLTLGLIYAERGIWRSDAQFRNAFFQLSNALRVARDREAKGTKRMPLAQVEELLASEYGRRGQKQLQARELINAARSRLALDQPAHARRLVTEANEIGASDENDARRLAELQTILGFYERIPSLQRLKVDGQYVTWDKHIGESFGEKFATSQAFKINFLLAGRAYQLRDLGGGFAFTERSAELRYLDGVEIISGFDQFAADMVEFFVHEHRPKWLAPQAKDFPM